MRPRPCCGREGPGCNSLRVLRGGGWSNGPQVCRSASRGRINPDDRCRYGGFRTPITPEEVWAAYATTYINQGLAKAGIFLANATRLSDLDKAEMYVRVAKQLLDSHRGSLGAEECAKQLSKINDMLSKIAKKRRALAEAKAEGT